MKDIEGKSSGPWPVLPKPRQWLLWIILAIFLKSLFFIYKVHFEDGPFSNEIYKGTFAYEYLDSKTYIEPTENFVSKGMYWSEKQEDYRMPGYAWVYWLFRQFLSVPYSLDAIVLLQLLMASVSVYFLGIISLRIFRRDIYFYLVFFLYAMSTFVSRYDYQLMTESFCTSSFIFSLYFLFDPKRSSTSMALAGLFFAWCIFLKPIMAGLLMIVILFLLVRSMAATGLLYISLKVAVVFVIPFMVLDGIWVGRNYKKYNRFIPLTKSVLLPSYPPYQVSILSFLASYGGSANWEEPNSEIRFFLPGHGQTLKPGLPPYIYTSKFNYDSLSAVRRMIACMRDSTTDSTLMMQQQAAITERLDRYTTSIKKEKPLLYQVYSRLVLFKLFLFHTGTHSLFTHDTAKLNKAEWLLKTWSSVLYIYILIFGLAGILLLFVRGFKNFDYMLIAMSGLFLSLVFPFVIRLCEFRYFTLGYPIFLLAAIYMSLNLTNKMNHA